MRFAALCLAVFYWFAGPVSAQSIAAGRDQFQRLCAGCHGAEGAGGERGPDIVSSRRTRRLNDQELGELIRNGIPAAGMPAFPLNGGQMREIVAYVRSLIAPAAESPAPGDAAAGEAFFFGEGGCAACHMVKGRGGISGPDLSDLGRRRRSAEIDQALRAPGTVRTPGYEVATVRLRNGRSIRGFLRNESNYDLQLQDFTGAFHLLRQEQISGITREKESIMPPLEAAPAERQNLLAYLTRLSGSPGPARQPVSETAGAVTFADLLNPKPGEWPTYHGRLSGNRYSPLRQIGASNVSGLAPRWIFQIPNAGRLETTPVVVNGVMYVTAVNEVYALDAGTGRQIWHYARPRSRGLVGDAAGGINRGVAVLGDRVFLVTDNAHLIALHRVTGGLLWDVEMADSRQNYGATSAPLAVKDLVISGVSGGDEGVRGFVAAYKAATGERVWRFWTIPAPGEPLAKTWAGKALEHGCGTAWLTGTYDPETDLLFWGAGNPCPDYNGDERQGDNLYSSSVLALRPETGELKWYYQYTPNDVHDWDAEQTPMVVDAEFQGRSRRLLLQANRNGFFYVLDRTDGSLLRATPFVEKLTWASGIGPDGRPRLLPGAEPTPEGVRACPAVEGATNWMSSAYNPETGLFYLMALEKCNIYRKSPEVWEPGKSFYGGSTKDIPGEPGKKYLRAIDLRSGKIAWEYPQIGPATTWGGVLATAGGLVFFCDDSGAFAAVDAKTGKLLWHFSTSQSWRASPMTYMADGRQFVAVAAGSVILAFGLP